MHAPTGGCAAPAIAAQTTISPPGAESGISAMATIAADAIGRADAHDDGLPAAVDGPGQRRVRHAQRERVDAGGQAAARVGPGQRLGVQDQEQAERAHLQACEQRRREEERHTGGAKDGAHGNNRDRRLRPRRSDSRSAESNS